MRLQTATWPEVETYLEKSKGIIVPIGSTEQHGPNGMIGTDAICPETIGQAASEGCIRMHNRDVEELFDLVADGTVVVVRP